MKSILLGLLVLSISTKITAEEVREYKKTSSTEALVTIHTEEQDNTQAAAYVDAQENDKFISDLQKDPQSSLAKLIKEIELRNCDATSTPDKSWIDGCGEITITKEVKTGFGRGGWASAGASYKFFVGFTSDGSGRFFSVSHMVTISESAEAQVDGDYNYSGVVLKTLTLDNITKIAEDF